MAQYLEGLPGLVTREGRQFAGSDTPEFDQDILLFYEQYLAIEDGSLHVDDSRFRMGEGTSTTFRSFMQTIERANPSVRALKGQIVGPFTLLSGLKDQDGRALIYDERFLDIIPKLLGLKARWQIEIMKTFGVPVIIFLDEPALAGFGSSAFITVSAEQVVRLLAEVADAVHAAEGSQVFTSAPTLTGNWCSSQISTSSISTPTAISTGSPCIEKSASISLRVAETWPGE